MSNTRLKKPLHNLTQTAKDLADHLNRLTKLELFEILSEIRKSYGSVKDSYIWSRFYSRERVPQLDTIIEYLKLETQTDESIQQNDTNAAKLKASGWMEMATNLQLNALMNKLVDDNVDSNEDLKNKNLLTNKPSALEIIVYFLKAKGGGWIDTSANVVLLRALMTKLKAYDPNATLTVNEIVELNILFPAEIKNNLNTELQKRQAQEQMHRNIEAAKKNIESHLSYQNTQASKENEERLKEAGAICNRDLANHSSIKVQLEKIFAQRNTKALQAKAEVEMPKPEAVPPIENKKQDEPTDQTNEFQVLRSKMAGQITMRAPQAPVVNKTLPLKPKMHKEIEYKLKVPGNKKERAQRMALTMFAGKKIVLPLLPELPKQHNVDNEVVEEKRRLQK